MTMPSNKWEEAVDEILNNLCMHSQKAPDGTVTIIYEGISPAKAKLALTNAVKELVETAKPYSTKYDAAKALRAGTYKRGQEQYHGGYNQALDTYQSNLLKAIGESDDH